MVDLTQGPDGGVFVPKVHCFEAGPTPEEGAWTPVCREIVTRDHICSPK